MGTNWLFILTIVLTALLLTYKLLQPALEKRFKFKKYLKITRTVVLSITIILAFLTAITEIIERKNSVRKSKEEVMYKKILVDPDIITIPSNVTLPQVPILITNNYSFPVYPLFSIEVKEGPINLNTDFILNPFFGGGLWTSKLYSCIMPGIPAGSTFAFIARFDASKYRQNSYLEVKIESFMKNPIQVFLMDSITDLPEKLVIPENFTPKVYKNGEKEVNIK
jgi:hypothetical protein